MLSKWYKYNHQILNLNKKEPYEIEGIEREIRVHLACNHPNIVKLYGSFIENNTYHLVMDYIPGGNLYYKI